MAWFSKTVTELTVVDLGKELVIDTTRKPSRPEALLSAVVTCGFVAILAYRFLGLVPLIMVAVLAGLLVFLQAARTSKVELRVTRLELKSRGPIPGEFGSTRSVCSADIQWLEYRNEEPGENGRPSGPYAVIGRRSTCLLPDLDAQQTNQLIDRIEARFPELHEQRRRADPFGQHFTTLKLNEPG